ncbi:MAG: amino acid ABC transporter permease [Treponema sp.]|nr:amino acid ABC transporter permease [Treponema sp.]
MATLIAYFERIKLLKLLTIMLKSSVVSLEVFFLTLIFSIPLALLICMGRMSRIKFISATTNIFMLIIRGTPLMLQLIFVYFAPAVIFHKGLGRFAAAIVAMVINYACYFAEIYRGGIQSIPEGQYEASKVLGFTKAQTFMRVVLPQLVKKIIPPLGNEVITLVKDTALVQVLGVVELFHVAQTQSGRLVSVVPLFIAGLFYFIMNWGVSKFFDIVEKKLDYYK